MIVVAVFALAIALLVGMLLGLPFWAGPLLGIVTFVAAFLGLWTWDRIAEARRQHDR